MRYLSAGVCLLIVCSAATAQEVASTGSHVRAESADVRTLIAEAEARSATVRALVEEIDRSDVVVYVRVRQFPTQWFDGRTGFVGARRPTRERVFQARFLIIEIACPRIRDMQMATLAHELQHAVEISRAPWVLGAATLAQYYTDIGDQVGGDATSATFETAAAREVGLRAWREFVGRTAAAEHR